MQLCSEYKSLLLNYLNEPIFDRVFIKIYISFKKKISLEVNYG